MTLSFLFDVKLDAAMVGVWASRRDRRQIVEHRVGVLSNGPLLIGPCPVSNKILPRPVCLDQLVLGQNVGE
jgi:hypothetical protein